MPRAEEVMALVAMSAEYETKDLNHELTGAFLSPCDVIMLIYKCLLQDP